MRGLVPLTGPWHPVRRTDWGRGTVAEIETLTVDEPLEERVKRHNFDRLLMLSDGVFAIALTLIALELRPPEHWEGGVNALVVQMWRPLFAYSAGFLIIGGFWAVHRRLFARLRTVDPFATLLSLLLLFLIAGVPAVAMLIADHGPSRSMLVYLTSPILPSTAGRGGIRRCSSAYRRSPSRSSPAPVSRAST
jgi:hypothetical protein